MAAKSVLVVVGTTKFDDLIKSATTIELQKLLLSKGYSKLTLQVGNGDYTPSTDQRVQGLELEWYRYKPSLAPDMKDASLIISHGGSGSIFESLSLNKLLVVVINETLMNNHQWELASQLANDKHLYHTTCKSLYETVKSMDPHSLVPYQPGNPKLFGDYLNNVMGFTKSD